ncbi:imelysin family protein [Hymenobacter seoulensis]
MKKFLLFALTLVLVAVGLISCQKDAGGAPEPSTGPDRRALLTHWADSLVKPGYQRFNDKLGVLKARTTAFTAAPTPATLGLLRQAWQEAYVGWQQVELYEFGPAEQVSLRNHFNIYPADVPGINRNISSGSYNFELSSAIPQQGFPTVDYLLNGVASGDEAIARQYAASANHRQYLTDVVAKMEQTFAPVYTQWNGTYRETFIQSTGTDASSSLSRVINAYSQYFERYLRAGKIGIPAGVMTGTPLPEKIEAYYRGGALPLQLATTAHATVQRFFNGRPGQPSLKSYLDALDAKDSRTGQGLTGIITTQLDASAQQLAALGPDLHQTITARNAAAVSAYNEMQKAVRLLKVDMTSALGITVTYVDNDGD